MKNYKYISLSNFGEQFRVNVEKKFYANALAPAIANRDAEGQIKKFGDILNILMFLQDISLNDYTVGSDMAVQNPVDTENQLHINRKKYYNFDIDVTDKIFTYVEDEDSNLIESAAKQLEKEVDQEILYNAQYAKAGSFVGINQNIVGDGADTSASIATTATGGTVTIDGGSVGGEGTWEAPWDGTLYRIGFGDDVLGKSIRLRSSTGTSTPWYRITAVTDSVTCSITNWDASSDAGSSPGKPAGDILYGLHGENVQNADGGATTENGWGWEIQAAVPTTVTASNVYDMLVEAAEKLDENDIPHEGRHISITPTMKTALLRASELQPSIGEVYNEVIENGKIGRIAGFDLHLVTGSKNSTRAGRSTSTDQGTDTTVSDGAGGTQILFNHISFVTFAHKFSESRVVDAEKQFAKLYQGLNLYGAKVTDLRRKSGGQIFIRS